MNDDANKEELNFIKVYIEICSILSRNFKFPLISSCFNARNASSAFVEFRYGIYTYGGYEKGRRDEIYSSDKMMDVMYYPVELAVKNFAQDYERRHRVDGEDFRIQYFRKSVEYMNKINPLWGRVLHENLSKYLEF